ncbi:methionyl-tRNA formyltransferase [Candidatus Eisenbacteria bacterium]|uniref:Methionyl-tRNA formyltransferase n=1 Tax=Eiseniibacteriota bacterium TaxID=2212470 RepID=A0ABV6YQD8_UNCEI
MRVIFAGSPAFAVPCLERLLRTAHQIVSVVTQPDRPAGRGLKLKACPVKEFALGRGLEVHTPEKFNTRSFRQAISDLEPDLMVVVAYGKIFRPRALALPRLGCVNLHASLLPRYRGVAPANWAIIEGETETGVTTIFMDEGIDTGDMILSRSIPIAEDETAGELLERLSALGAEVMAETCDLIAADKAVRVAQDHSLANYAPKLSKDDRQIRWELTAAAVHNHIRGVTPWPGAFTSLEGRPVKVKASRLAREIPGAAPGQVIDIDSDRGVLVSCGSGAIWLPVLQAEGRKAIAGADFARGSRLKVGDGFGLKTE